MPPDGKFIAVGTKSQGITPVQFWSVQTGNLERTLPLSWASVAFSPDGTLLACGGLEGPLGGHAGLKLWDLNTGRSTLLRLRRSFNVGWVVFSPNGKPVAALIDDHREAVQVWRVPTR